MADKMNYPIEPPQAAIEGSRRRVHNWFVSSAPLIQWAAMESPLGIIYMACSTAGLRSLDFGVSETNFLEQLDPLAHLKRDPDTLAPTIAQLDEYFAGRRRRFDLPVDLSQMTSFQQNVLRTAATIPAGTVWTYGQMAKTIGKPRASRAVGQALGSNPVPIIVPCHRVVGSDGSMTGYSGGGGVVSKKWLLHLEGAL